MPAIPVSDTLANPKETMVTIANAIGASKDRRKIFEAVYYGKTKRVKRALAYVALPEAKFKAGVHKLLGEPYVRRDWGGEKGDLHTTRVRVRGKRVTAAFAFKGPGKKGVLTPAGMGKRGDQIANLFETDAQ